MEYHQTKTTERNTIEKNQWRHRTNQKTKDKMAIGNSHTSITLNINGLNSPIKRKSSRFHKKKQNPTICYLQETYISYKNK